MYLFDKKATFRRLLRYLFFVVLILRILDLLFLINSDDYKDYLKSILPPSEYSLSKEGTFVEGVFGASSRLPYVNIDPNSIFYQSLMFRSCMDYEVSEDGVYYNKDLCKVTTNDYQTYYVTLDSDVTWSNGVLLGINDIYFTYKDILKENKFGLKHLGVWSNIELSLDSDTVKVVFPDVSKDNLLFFTNYILPEHIIIEPNIQMYKQEFAAGPVYNNCAKIQSQTKDKYSLVFDLSKCHDTNIRAYQIKNMESFDNLKKAVTENKSYIVNAYVGVETFTGYEAKYLNTDKYVIMFFNTKSDKLPVRTRRALGGFVTHNLQFSGDKESYLDSYDEILFNQFRSTGSDLNQFFDISAGANISEKDLKDSGIKIVPEKITIKGTNNAFVYSIGDNKDSVKLNFSFDQAYEKIAIEYTSGELYSLKSYSKSKKTANYIVGSDNKNLKEGLNNYVIYGFDKGKQKKLASINIYNVIEKSNEAGEKISILYIDNLVSSYLIAKLKNLFKAGGVDAKFEFEKVSGLSELEGKLASGEYDIVIGILDSSLKTEYYRFLFADIVNINPTNYINANLNSLLKQYSLKNDNYNIIKEVNDVYSKDMPFVILGKELTKLNIKPEVWEKLSLTGYLHEYNRQQKIYDGLNLTDNVYIQPDKVWNIKNFWRYLMD